MLKKLITDFTPLAETQVMFFCCFFWGGGDFTLPNTFNDTVNNPKYKVMLFEMEF